MKWISIAVIALLSMKAGAQNAASAISRGNEYYNTAQYDLAEKHYRAALKSEPNNTKAAYNLANALYRQKRYKESIGILKDLQGDPNDKAFMAAVHYNTGVNHTREKDLEASIESYKAALRLTPDDQQARENLQKALLELKKERQQNQQKQQRNSPMSQSEADRRLQQLQQKEKQIQERMQRNSQQKGDIMEKDW